MPLTIVVKDAPSITFDGARVVIGRGAACDVRLPDKTVSHRHASIRANAGVYSLVDEGSLNGTFVGKERLPPQVPHVLRSGERVRVGGVWLEVHTDTRPATLDLPLATRELALTLVARHMSGVCTVVTPEKELPLSDEGRAYTLGDVVQFTRKGHVVFARALAPGVYMGDAPMRPAADMVWKSQLPIAFEGATVTLREPLVDALAAIEAAPDEPLADSDVPAPPEDEVEEAPTEKIAPPPPAAKPKPERPRITAAEIAAVLLALLVIGASAAGIAWLLRR